MRALAVWKETPRSSLWPHGARLASPPGRECVRAPRGHVQMPPGGASPTWGQAIALNAGGGQGALLPAGPAPRPGVVRAGEGG